MVAVVIALLVIGFFFDAERDTIQFRPQQSWFPDWDYWVKKNWQKPWFVKLFPFWDGWHICKFIYHTCLFTAGALLAQRAYALTNLEALGVIIGIHLLYGTAFESSYGNEYL